MSLFARRPNLAAVLIASTVCAVLASCSWTPVAPYEGTAPRTETIYVAVLGWHTEIGLRVDAIHGPLMKLAREFPSANYLTFGWGQYDYYMATNPGIADLLRAVVPGPAVMLVSALPHSPPETFGTANVYAIPVSPEGLDRLSDYLWEYLEKDSAGGLRRVGNGPSRESAFYTAVGTYDIGNTCNTWTAEALKVSGLPVSVTGVVFASQLADQLRLLAVPSASDLSNAHGPEASARQCRSQVRCIAADIGPPNSVTLGQATGARSRWPPAARSIALVIPPVPID